MRVQEQRGAFPDPTTACGADPSVRVFDLAETDAIVERYDSIDETLNLGRAVVTSMDEASELPTQIEGSQGFVAAVMSLLAEFRDCFRRTVAAELAKIPAMEIVDKEKWESSRQAKAPLRHGSGSKDEETRRQVKILHELNSIEQSDAASWSQVHLTPKQEVGLWRFCLDYRFLNDCSRSTAYCHTSRVPWRKSASEDPRFSRSWI